MEETITKILNEYYNYQLPEIRDLTVLDRSPKLGIICIRWRVEDSVITVKCITRDDELIITRLV